MTSPADSLADLARLIERARRPTKPTEEERRLMLELTPTTLAGRLARLRELETALAHTSGLAHRVAGWCPEAMPPEVLSLIELAGAQLDLAVSLYRRAAVVASPPKTNEPTIGLPRMG